jgi:hypothetical protein
MSIGPPDRAVSGYTGGGGVEKFTAWNIAEPNHSAFAGPAEWLAAADQRQEANRSTPTKAHDDRTVSACGGCVAATAEATRQVFEPDDAAITGPTERFASIFVQVADTSPVDSYDDGAVGRYVGRRIKITLAAQMA